LRDQESVRFHELRPRGSAALRHAKSVMPNGVPMSWMATLYEHPPIVVDGGAGATFADIDGNAYLDFNLADTSMFTGYGVAAITEAVAARSAAGVQFLLPTEDAAAVAEQLHRRFGLPFWQFTLSATMANTEAIRVARAVTGREDILMFDGKYHGHADELLGEVDHGAVVPFGRGVLSDATRRVRLVAYNDLPEVERELAGGRVACVIAEAAITNAGVILPQNGFHAELRRLTSETGTLLLIDETHTLTAGPGGLTRRWGLHPDLLVVGKSLSGGIPMGAYGMTSKVAAVLERPDVKSEEVATGGTLFANALSMAAARATLETVLTDEVYDHAVTLGGRLADGIESCAARHSLDWRAHRLFNRSGYTHGPVLPENASEARATFDADLFNTQRLFMANRGVWEAIDSAGPAIGIQTTAADVDRYLAVLDEFLAAVL
jgi:glutamate-1-semialdehyde 2,1-aminomutase